MGIYGVLRESGGKIYWMFAMTLNMTSRNQIHNALNPTTTMSNERETNEFTVSSKDLPKASKDQKDPTRKIEHPPLSSVKFDTFVYVLAFIALLAAVYFTSLTLKIS